LNTGARISIPLALNSSVKNNICIVVNRDDSDEDDEEDDGSNQQAIVSVNMEDVKDGKFHLIYAHPETLVENRQFGKILRSRAFSHNVGCIVVDEVHMVSEWYGISLKIMHSTMLFNKIICHISIFRHPCVTFAFLCL